jgi:hypothetical protein
MNFFLVLMAVLAGVISLTSSIIGLSFYGKLSASEQKAADESRKYIWGMLISSVIITLITIAIAVKGS